MNFRLTSKTQFQVLGGLILATTIFSLLFSIIVYASESWVMAMLVVLPIYLVFYFLPVFLLHNNYLKYAKGMNIKINNSGIVANGQLYNVDDIISFEMFSTWQRKNKKGSAATLAHNEYYYFIKINLRNHEPIIINSLIGLSIDDALKQYFPDKPFRYHLHFILGLMIIKGSFDRSI